MLTRTWTGHVSPEWTIRVGRDEDSAALDPSWAEADDGTLVALCLAGQRAAFDVIVERHRRQVYQLCYRYVGNHEDAADLAQDAFIRAFKGLKGFKGAVESCDVALSHRGERLPQPSGAQDADGPSRSSRPSAIDLRAERPDIALLRDERAAEVRAAIRQLPPKQRATLILRVYHELPHEEIAGILGSSVGAAKANLFHALANLKKLLQ